MITKIDDFIKRVESTAEEDFFTPRTFYHLSSSMFHEMCELLKEQEAVTIKRTKENVFGVYGGTCPKCHNWIQSAHSFCGFCGQEVKWE